MLCKHECMLVQPGRKWVCVDGSFECITCVQHIFHSQSRLLLLRLEGEYLLAMYRVLVFCSNPLTCVIVAGRQAMVC